MFQSACRSLLRLAPPPAILRLGKECIFLQYEGEGHGLRKYPNKLDYARKMKEYFDHYLKGKPAPEWLGKGVPYRGK